MTGESGQVWKDRGKHHQVYRCIYYGMLPTAVLTGVEVLLMGAVGAFGFRQVRPRQAAFVFVLGAQ